MAAPSGAGQNAGMTCPRCRKPLIGIAFDGVEVDACPPCGLWLDAGELEALARRHGAIPLAPVLTSVKAERTDCCRCREASVLLRHAASGILVDRCRQGCGIWLDRGELEAILAAEGTANGATTFFRNLFPEHATQGGPSCPS